MRFNVGDRVRVHGCEQDYTMHLDGEIGTVILATDKDCLIQFEPNVCLFEMWAWNWNLTLVEDKE